MREKEVSRRQFLHRSGTGALAAAAGSLGAYSRSGADASLQVATFEVDATPPIGSPMSYGTVQQIDDPLSCRGVILLPDEALPIVVATVDWIGNYNGGYDAWRMALAEAAQTAPDRVAMHALHQHTAPGLDFDAKMLWMAQGEKGEHIDVGFARATIRRAAEAVVEARKRPVPVTRIGTGKAKVEKFASNRRLLGPDGKVLYGRMSNTKGQPHLRELPEGLVDPFVRVISLWNRNEPLVAMSYYATHPQSYYRNGGVSWNTVGIARQMRQESTDVFHIHFNGAGGNVAAGKYNDRSEENRQILARRLAKGMAAAWSATETRPIAGTDVGWRVYPAHLPAEIRDENGQVFTEEELVGKFTAEPNYRDARDLAWLYRSNMGHKIPLTCLRLGEARILHMPGELFVEYQLAAQEMRSDLFVAMAAYGDGGPGYIGTQAAYPKGGYEVGWVSNVAPAVEETLTDGMRDLLGVPASQDIKMPSEFTEQKQQFN